jgi:hypothetical protein
MDEIWGEIQREKEAEIKKGIASGAPSVLRIEIVGSGCNPSVIPYDEIYINGIRVR